jgi:hypothetical protein
MPVRLQQFAALTGGMAAEAASTSSFAADRPFLTPIL